MSELMSICFSVLVILVHIIDGLDAAVDHHFHTVQITSLLPAPICTTSTSTNTKGGRKSTLDVFHRHGPCSQLGQDKSTNKPSLRNVLSHDEPRVKALQARVRPKSNTNMIADNKVNLPAQSESLGPGNYYVKVGLGTPTNYVSLSFDTGSDLTWTQCQPCSGSCYKQQDPIFNPSSSTSYSNITCTSNLCSQLRSATGNNPRCFTSTCIYETVYADNSFSAGFFSSDKLTISATDVFPNFLFGCGQDNQGLFSYSAGLLGLGRDGLSLVSQTSGKYGKYFSYCLPSVSSSSGYLTLGAGTSANVKFTPFSSSQGSSLYFIDILAISVGGHQLPISASTFSTARTIIDSGTVITRLPPAAYSAMRTAFQQLMSTYPRAPATSLLDTCYDFSNYTSVKFPTISFTFGGNVNVNLDFSGIFVFESQSRACLAFAGNDLASDVGIFGNTQQKTLQVVYDVAGGKLGFGAGGCK